VADEISCFECGELYEQQTVGNAAKLPLCPKCYEKFREAEAAWDWWSRYAK
jgi:formylmethanofuran dehydrogenase subunit E